jgi:hypothetical protein
MYSPFPVVNLCPHPELINNLSVMEILVAHQNRDHTKWGTGLTISEWLIEDKIEAEAGALEIQEKIFAKVQEAATDCWLRTEIYYAWMRYFHFLATPYVVRNSASQINFFIPKTENTSRDHQVKVWLYAYLIPRQSGAVIWFKGGIQINHQFQVMKWTPYDL